MDVVLALPLSVPPMTTLGTDARVLKWTFRRQHETVVCQLGLNRDHSAYELRMNPPWDLQDTTTEVFDDVMPALQRHAAVERVLIDEGWLLEGFETVSAATTSVAASG
jgi:hypothetical protein